MFVIFLKKEYHEQSVLISNLINVEYTEPIADIISTKTYTAMTWEQSTDSKSNGPKNQIN